MINRRTILRGIKTSAGGTTVRKLSRRAIRTKARASMTKICPASMGSQPKLFRRNAMAARSFTAKNKIIGCSDGSKQCVCSVTLSSGKTLTTRPPPPPGFKTGYTGRITRSISAVLPKETGKKGLKAKQLKQNRRRKNRKRQALKGLAHGAVIKCS